MDLQNSIWIDGASDKEIELDCRFARLAYEIIHNHRYKDVSAVEAMEALVALRDETNAKWFDLTFGEVA